LGVAQALNKLTVVTPISKNVSFLSFFVIGSFPQKKEIICQPIPSAMNQLLN